ncbi:MAG: hypothetical protein PPFGHCPK_00157 [Spiroplasma endosymbiont of Drosophila atripex]|nr:MAG: hypothetical protein PPFGHCPK_00157 [Spiroplasma endosymbiont of Drosophila atripex]
MNQNNKEEFNLIKYNHLIATADDFFEASERCSFKSKKWPLMAPNFTNRAFACELYLKATLYLTKGDIPKKHKLNELFEKLKEKDRNEIYNIWRKIDGQNIENCSYARDMFCDNLEANSDVFTRFRYVHEWAGSTISLQSSFVEKQMHLHSFSTSRSFGSLEVYDGFLDQFAKSIKQYNNELTKILKRSWTS